MQELLKNLIITVNQAGLSRTVYLSFEMMAMFAGMGVAIYYAYKMEYSPGKGILLQIMGFWLSYIWMYVYFWVLSGFTKYGGQNHVTVIVYEPLLYAIPAKLLKLDVKKIWSALAVGTPLVQGVGHIGCVFTGCCAGYPAQWGIYNIPEGTYLFPNQWLEVCVAVGIAIYMMYRIKKNKYQANLNDYPVMLVLFGFTRFLLEFLRANEKILWGCSKLAFHALFMFVVGIVVLMLINKKEHSATSSTQQSDRAAI